MSWITVAVLAPRLLAAQADSQPPISGSAQVYVQLAEGEDPLPVGIVGVDARSWHFEGRYNYEDVETASVWLGWNLSYGSTVTLDLTPMAALVVGTVNGVAPGVELTLSWKELTFYDEMELVVPFNGDPSYFVSWSTTTWRFSDVLQPGFTVQRFRVFEGEREVDWGLALASEFGRFSTGVYAFAPFGATPFWQLSAEWAF